MSDKILETFINKDRGIKYNVTDDNTHLKIGHPEFLDKMDIIQEVCENTDFACTYTDEIDKEHLYRVGLYPKRPEIKACVIVRKNNKTEFNVVTAFERKRIKEGGTVRYVKSKK